MVALRTIAALAALGPRAPEVTEARPVFPRHLHDRQFRASARHTPAEWSALCAERRARLVATMPLLDINPRTRLGTLKALAGERAPRHHAERVAVEVVEAHAAMKAAEHMYADEVAAEMLALAEEG